MILAHFIGKKNWQNGRIATDVALDDTGSRCKLRNVDGGCAAMTTIVQVRRPFRSRIWPPGRLIIAGADAVMGKMDLLRTARRRQFRALCKPTFRDARTGRIRRLADETSCRLDGREFERFASNNGAASGAVRTGKNS